MNFIITVATSKRYALTAATEREALEEIDRFRHLGWTEEVTDLGAGPTTYTVEATRP